MSDTAPTIEFAEESGTLVLNGTEVPDITGTTNENGSVTITAGTVTQTMPPERVPIVAGLVKAYGVPGATTPEG